MTLVPAIRKYAKQTIGTAVLCLFSFLVAVAQGATSQPDMIKGTVVDSASQALLKNVTVAVLSTRKGQAIKSTVTNNNGLFTISGPFSKERCQLLLTCTGYKEKIIELPLVASSALNVGQVALVSLAKTLEEVQVVSHKPIIEQDLDKLIYNVEEDPESYTASALDILRKVPLLSVDADDNLLLKGSSDYRILINGKSSALFLSNQSDLFKSLPASAIKRIEVITMPSSRYEAQGIGGLINIITYKKNLGGYTGGFNLRASTPQLLSLNSNLAASSGKFGLSGNFGHNSSVSPVTNSFFYRQDKQQQSQLEQTGASEGNFQSHNGSAEIRYEMSAGNLLTIGYSDSRSKGFNNFNQQVVLLNSKDSVAALSHSANLGQNWQHSHDLALDFQHSSRKNEAQQFTFSYKWNQSTGRNSTDFAQFPSVYSRPLLSLTQNDEGFSEHAFHVDYVQPFKKQIVELGISSNFRQSNSTYFYQFEDTALGDFRVDSNRSNHFFYKEDLYAAYASLSLRMGKWGIRAGSRMEQALLDARFISTSTKTAREYKNTIPSLAISFQFKAASTLRLSYTQRIDRPDLSFLNPYVYRTDPWNISYGNPDLRPAVATVFNLTYTSIVRRTFITIDLSHYVTNNAIQPFTILGADTISRTTLGNSGHNRNSSFSLAVTTTVFRKLSVNLNSGGNYMEYSSTINGKALTNKGLTYRLAGSVNLRLKSWRLGGNFSYAAPNLFVQGKTASYTSTAFSVNKYFLKNNKITTALQVSSPFQKYRHTLTEINDPAFYQLHQSYTVVRRLSLSVYYNFGKVQGGSSLGK